MKLRYAVMGNPVAHSLSPVIHQLFAEQTGLELIYDKILLDEACFEQQITGFFAGGGAGLNITMPGKQRAYALADQVTGRCLQAKAANTLWRDASGIHADNTDGVGLIRDLQRHMDIAGKRILVLGAGGAARGIAGPLLAENPLQLVFANRTLERAQALCLDFPSVVCTDLISLNEPFDLVVNATPASFQGESLLLPSTIIHSKTICYDLAYRLDSATSFVQWAKSLQCMALDGLGMLVEQAAEAFFIWHGLMPDTIPVLQHLNHGRYAII